MRLDELLEDVQVQEVDGSREIEITGLGYDSRRVKIGDVFFALPGLRHEGEEFAWQAAAAGAAAVVARRILPLATTTRVRVEDPRLALAQAAARYHGYPSRSLGVVGVTGTNGKTTVTYLTAAVLEAMGQRTAVFGTIGYRLGDETRTASFTTPEASELQGLLREAKDRGFGAVALELSSHALHQRRCFAVECDVVVFTNLSHDHLDYHGTWEEYLDAKLRLFDGRNGTTRKAVTAVINTDDPAAASVLAAARQGTARQWTFGRDPRADFRATRIACGQEGVAVSIEHEGGHTEIALPLLGEINAMNAVAAFAAGRALGAPREAAARGLAGARPVPGRLERIEGDQRFEVVVDYAHTPDALERVLAALRSHVAAGRRLVVVFGCGGDRDPWKRPRMGEVASRLADRIIVTSDNPRSEDPAAIIAAVVAGIPSGGPRVETVPDRREAIARALAGAQPGDVVLVAGKGHETTQTLATQVIPFDDRAVVRELLAGAS